jgi:hypothetical protein
VAENDRVRGRLDATTWAGVGIVGLVVFVIGIYQPIWAHVRYGQLLQIAVAVVGGIVVALGFGYAYDAREAAAHPPKRPPPAEPDVGSIQRAPSFEVYRPGEEDDVSGRDSR